MRSVVGGSIDASGEMFHEQDRCAVEPGGVTGDCNGDDDCAHGPQRREQ